MKTIKCSLAALCSCAFVATVLSYYLVSPVSADVGEAPRPGAAITSGDTVEDVEMKEEKVVFDIKDGDENPCPWEYLDSCWFAEVSADFLMQNTSSKDKQVEIFYPFPDMYRGELHQESTDVDYYENWDFVVKVDGATVDFEIDIFDYITDDREDPTKLPSLVFPVNFAANQETRISISYKNRFVYQPKSHYGSFIYIMDTGSHWEGDIDKGEIIFKFPAKPVKNIFKDFDDRFEFDGVNLVWEFEQLEPNEEDNITVTFSPELFNIWEDKNISIEDVRAGEFTYDDWGMFWDNIDEIIPEGVEKAPGTRINGNHPLFLLDQRLKHLDEDFWSTWGWFGNINDDPFVHFELDAVYKVDGFEIFSGVPMNVYSPQDSGDEYFFDLFDRPKTLELTFSDGSSQEIVLEDNPDEFMEIELDSEVETSFVKVQILDTYESRTGSSKFVGISYLSFDIGDKVAEKPQDEDDSSGSQSEESEEDSQEQEHSQTIMDYVASNLPVILGIAFIVVILMGVAIYFVVRKMHKKKGKLKEGERSFEDK